MNLNVCHQAGGMTTKTETYKTKPLCRIYTKDKKNHKKIFNFLVSQYYTNEARDLERDLLITQFVSTRFGVRAQVFATRTDFFKWETFENLLVYIFGGS